MLDTDTKRRIDTARDILVGKVPDPKSQVEQITVALIYKFMDDMDAESEELGGKRTFFAGDYAPYGWSKLMRSGLGGHEMIDLYVDGTRRMPENPGLPALFRSIFRNYYLPYHDPETLRMFLKVIDEFEYDHSERLGDAFEYLLSVLGSQGDAGQFRTPRHIIDFMVEIVDPKKHETVLDPACGTAGFLISSYKHILAANADAEGQSTLTPDEKARLVGNFKGYDISPDMVRLSLVNLYLHGFPNPTIIEYDTLTSLDRWNEQADVILANPPFMSPKGGIQPHKRFSVQSKRSEVLFVDYMAEHLSPTGRAGIIVPEGIIFQSQTAHKDLRKLLVEQSLVAVISLPSGVFNPYSGVKTSILILDKALARKSASIGFFKVENDGYGLGAQRREIAQNDLPAVRAEVAEYLRRLRAGEPVEDYQPMLGLIVPKEKIAANGEYNLGGERYREETRFTQLRWPIVPLGDFCTFMTGGTPTSTDAEYYENGSVPWLVSGDIHRGEIYDCERRITEQGVKESNARYLPKNSVLIALNGQGKTRGTVALLRMAGATCNQSLVAITPAEPLRAISEYVYRVLRSMYADIRALTGDSERSGLNIPLLKGIRIPLPPLDVQREIVAEIEGYQKVMDGARAVLDAYRPQIPIDPAWPMVELGEICELARGVTYAKEDEVAHDGCKVLRANNIDRCQSCLDLSDVKQVFPKVPFSDDKRLRKDDIFICLASGSKDHIGKVAYIDSDTDFYFGGFMGAVRCQTEHVVPKYMYFHLVAGRFNDFLRVQIAGANINNLGGKLLSRFAIPLPPLATQQAIVAELEAEQALVAANRELIARMGKRIQATLARVWGEEKPQHGSAG
jgi:type I restriction enzyme M protein